MLWEALRAIAGFLLFMTLWFAVQALVRRRKSARPDTDVLDHVKHGCGHCPQEEGCSGTTSDHACPTETLIQIRH